MEEFHHLILSGPVLQFSLAPIPVLYDLDVYSRGRRAGNRTADVAKILVTEGHKLVHPKSGKNSQKLTDLGNRAIKKGNQATIIANEAKLAADKAKEIVVRANGCISARQDPALSRARVEAANLDAIAAARKAERVGREVEKLWEEMKDKMKKMKM